MATKKRYILIDDIDGSNAAETVMFAVGRNRYEIDLSLEHVAEFNEDLEKWIKHARRAPVRRQTKVSRTGTLNDAPQIRAWAASKGIEVAERGRIPSALRDQYRAETA